MLGSGWSAHLELLLLSPGSLRVGTCCPQFLSCLDPQLIQLGLRTGSAALQGLQGCRHVRHDAIMLPGGFWVMKEGPKK